MKKAQENAVEIPAISIQTIQIKLVGDSPFICHAWSEKAKKEMLSKQMKKAVSGKTAKDPFKDFCDSLYWLSEKPEHPTMEDVQNARFGFPVIGFKASAVSAGFRNGIFKNKTGPNGAFHINGEFAEIEGIPAMREDMVRVGMGTADLRYRGEFKQWSTVLTIRFNPFAISAEQICNLFNVGGFACGVGEWRPEKGGSYGMYHVT